MKQIGVLLTLLSLSFVACSTEEHVSADVVKDSHEVSAQISHIDVEDAEEVTRSAMVHSTVNDGLDFEWQVGDVLMVYASGESIDENGAASFPIKQIDSESKNKAKFRGSGFEITPNKKYYAFSQYAVASGCPDKQHIKYNFAGQRQIATNDVTHLGAFDYNAAVGVANENGYVEFPFKHMGFFAWFHFTIPEGGTFTKLEVRSSDNSFFQNERVIDITKIGDDDFYTTQGIVTKSTYDDNDIFCLNLGAEDVGMTCAPNGVLDMYMVMPQSHADLIGKQLIFTLVPKDNSAQKFYAVANPSKIYEAGKLYKFTKTVVKAGELSLRVKVNPDWQLGNTLTRAGQGDPGLGKECHAPKYLYPFVAISGTNGEFKPLGEIVTNNDEKSNGYEWKLSDGLYVYQKALSTTLTNSNVNTNSGQVYVIASDVQLNLSAYTTEELLKQASYSIPNDNSQDYLKNLYSTPLVTSDKIPYTGTINGLGTTTPSADVTLYHVAAKVDVQWNSSTTMSGNVSINNLPTTDLSLFEPTTNTVAGSWSPNEVITPGTMYIGRHAFYVPQLNSQKYNISVGNSWTNDVQFKSSTENGWTSWLKANIEIK